ncbi:UDP-galactose transporter [Dacryopinax primogenitus]|uniref:GDP-mannose transporter n=1 Tax=Dacryopinax primogenitus (strain DJM 731) TaxID=1858805 RepID=M5G0R1_DACPD|nr:UDP-galactose transporter [Dacryopinax primogenitus]EJU03841.1 UDP-galactose transporter [Dacryopinax primogenitus]
MADQKSPAVEYKPVPTKEEEKRPGSVGEKATNPVFPILSYCCSSILMTVVNKYVLSGRHFSMNFLLLAIQSIVCVSVVATLKRTGVISFRDFDMKDAKNWFPISFALVVVIYTGSKSLQFLTIPVYTIFKNLTIILIAYGEVLWFGGHVTGLTLVSFFLMVLSSIIAAWSDITNTINALTGVWSPIDQTSGTPLPEGIAAVGSVPVNLGYLWMFLNCLASAAYVLGMRKRIKATGFKDWDSMFYNNLLSIPVLIVFSLLVERWTSENLTLNFPPESRNFLLFAMVLSGGVAVLISYTTAWCVRVTSSTTYSMVGALNKLPVAASGMIFFGDAVTLGSVSGVTTGFLAGVVYAIAKQNQSKTEKAKQGEGGIPMYTRKQ